MSSRENRITSVPDTPPPVLKCPKCDRVLGYRRTLYGGVQPPERWDFYRCDTCGPFKYRHRTRQLSSTSGD